MRRREQMDRRAWARQVGCGLAGCAALGWAPAALAQGPVRVVWIHRSDPPNGRRSRPELFYEHSRYMGSDLRAISVNASKPLADLAPAGGARPRGTCLEYIFKLRQADQFLIVASIPKGGPVGSRKGLDLAEELKLARGETVVLKFSARRLSDTTARVSFGVGGMREGKEVDDITTVLSTKEDLVELSADWKEFVIPIEDGDRPIAPRSLISPFRVMAKEEDNPAPSTVTVLVKDLRFEIKR